MTTSLDKCFAFPKLAEFVVEKTLLHIPIQTISEFYEPSAGDGIFKEQLDKTNIPAQYFDIDLTSNKDFIEYQDFLTTNIPYKAGRVVITGPPYSGLNWYRFATKSSKIGDYTAFISPYSVLDRKYPIATLELLGQYELGLIPFRRNGVVHKVKTCVMIYKTCKAKDVYKPINDRLKKDFKIGIYKKHNPPLNKNWEYFISNWGNRSGAMTKIPGHFSGNIVVNILNEKMRPKFEHFIKTFEEDYRSIIQRYSANKSQNTLRTQQFKNFLYDYFYNS